MAKKDTRKITASGSSSKVVNKTLKPGSMATNAKMVVVKPKAKASTKYSPAPMSAAAKAKAKAAGAATQGATGKLSPAQKKMFKALPREGSRSKAGSATVSKVAKAVAKRVKTTAREARDVVTAVGTVGNAAYNTVSNKTNPFKTTVTSKKNIAGSVKNLAKQVKEVGVASATGKKGTTSAQSGGRARGPKYTTNSGGSFQERELKSGKKRK